jgi:protocatechuate 3,4-dioxygenase beta subunit
MRAGHLLRIVAVASGLLAAGSAGSPAHACSCMESGPACQAFWTTAAVFDATVVAIENIETDELLGGDLRRFTRRLVKLDVRKGWKGVTAGPLEVVTNPDEASCGFEFRLSGRYLIFADDRRVDGRMTVSRCSATRAYDGTGDAAAFLASLEAPPKGGRVFGTVTLTQNSFGTTPRIDRKPVEVPVRLSGGGRTVTTTSTGGRYAFDALAPGRYVVDFLGPAGYGGWAPSREIEIQNARACAETNFSMSPDGRITGRVIDAAGRGIAGVHVEVTGADVPVPEYGGSGSVSDLNGFFEFRSLPPGRYLVGTNLQDLPSQYRPYARVMYPGDDSAPQIIELALGQAADLGQWTLPPPLQVVRISGIVVKPDGTPAAGAYVGLWDRTGNPLSAARGAGGTTTNANGEFVIDGRLGREYTFHVRYGSGPGLKFSAPRITAREGLPPVRIVIQGDPPK